MPRGSVPRLCPPHPPAPITPAPLSSLRTHLNLNLIRDPSARCTYWFSISYDDPLSCSYMMSMFTKPMTFCIRSPLIYFASFFFQILFFSDFSPRPLPLPPSYLPTCRLPISVYILSTSSSPHNNNICPIFIVFICPISIPTPVKSSSSSSSSQQLPLAFPLHRPHLFIKC
ncbi:hypothetical protein BJY52DRAFT_227898 [Lactarius psammicola]|nr:hypothetical protein BJY52DRAFT_227898 [Lactarius psammicola]